MSIPKKHIGILVIALISILGLFLRLYKINFGLPYIFLYDETDIYDHVIRYAFNYKFMLAEGGVGVFAPDSYVYGTFPTYFLTLLVMSLNKAISIFKFSVDFDWYFVFMRIVTSIFSFAGAIFPALIFKRLYKDNKESFVVFFITALNWKLVAHSHYLNQDTYLATLFIASLYFFIVHITKQGNKSYVPLLISSILFGFGVGTKITALITLPLVFLILFLKKDIKGIVLYSIGTFSSFGISNLFSIINFQSFISRIMLMKSVEAGAVFGSVDQNPFKYLISLFHMVTPPLFILSLIGMYEVTKRNVKSLIKGSIQKDFYEHLLLTGSFAIYLVFFSLSMRMVSRWMLPIIPIALIYSIHGLSKVDNLLTDKKNVKFLITSISLIIYLIYALSLTKQLKIGKPRVNAYLWTKEYTEIEENKYKKILMYTNKGERDIFQKIKNCDLVGFKVYEAREAYNFYPRNPLDYDLVITYSNMYNNYKSAYVKRKYPDYHEAWMNFENTLRDTNHFRLIKEYKTTKLNLIGVSEIYIYEKIK